MPGSESGVALATVQRRRLLMGAMHAASDLGTVSVARQDVLARAGVPRSVFDGLFPDGRECALAALAAGYAEILRAARAGRASAAGQAPVDRVRAGVVEVLGLLDAQPALAQVCVVRARVGGPRAGWARRRAVGALADGLRETLGSNGGLGPAPVDLPLFLVGGASELLCGQLARAGRAWSLQALTVPIMHSVCMAFLGTGSAQRQARMAPGEPVHDWAAPDWTLR